MASLSRVFWLCTGIGGCDIDQEQKTGLYPDLLLILGVGLLSVPCVHCCLQKFLKRYTRFTAKTGKKELATLRTCCTLIRMLRISSSYSFNPRPWRGNLQAGWIKPLKLKLSCDLWHNNPIFLRCMAIEQIIKLIQLGQVPGEVGREWDIVWK